MHIKTGRVFISNVNFIIYICTFLFFTFIINTLYSGNGVLGYASNISRSDLHNKVNSYRINAGMNPLNLNPKLNEAAYNKAQDMFSADYWAHISPSGKTPATFVDELGFAYIVVGENLAMDFDSSSQVVKAWQKSTSHNQNLLGDYTDVGYAIVNGELQGSDTTLVVQMFIKPKYVPPPVTSQVSETNDKTSEEVVEQVDELIAIKPIEETIVDILGEDYQQVNEVVSNQNVSFENDSELTPNWGKLLPTSKQLALGFVGFIIVLYIIDVILYIDLYRVKHTGNTLAHIVFLLFAMVIILRTTSGVIL